MSDETNFTAEDSPEESLDEQFARLQAEIEQERDAHLRALADLRNYRDRVAREFEQHTRFATASLLESLLPTLDHLDMALQAAQEHGESETSLAEALYLTQRQLLDTLAQAGLQPIAALGEVFDPTRHEAVAREEVAPGDPSEGTVTQELRRGYLLHDRVLRPAQVRVAVSH